MQFLKYLFFPTTELFFEADTDMDIWEYKKSYNDMSADFFIFNINNLDTDPLEGCSMGGKLCNGDTVSELPQT